MEEYEQEEKKADPNWSVKSAGTVRSPREGRERGKAAMTVSRRRPDRRQPRHRRLRRRRAEALGGFAQLGDGQQRLEGEAQVSSDTPAALSQSHVSSSASSSRLASLALRRVASMFLSKRRTTHEPCRRASSPGARVARHVTAVSSVYDAEAGNPWRLDNAPNAAVLRSALQPLTHGPD